LAQPKGGTVLVVVGCELLPNGLGRLGLVGHRIQKKVGFQKIGKSIATNGVRLWLTTVQISDLSI